MLAQKVTLMSWENKQDHVVGFCVLDDGNQNMTLVAVIDEDNRFSLVSPGIDIRREVGLYKSLK